MRFLLCVVVALCFWPVLTSAQSLTRVRVESEEAPALAVQLEREGFDVLEGSVGKSSLELIVSDEEFAWLIQRGLAPMALAYSRPFREIQGEWQQFGDDVPPGYLNLSQIIAEMNAKAAAYPSICKMVDLTTTYNVPATVQGRHMYAVKISDNVNQDEDEPVFLLVGCHHAREIVTPVIALEALNRLTSLYGSNPAVTAAVDKYEIWIAPVWNPDGYVYVFDVNNMWRKNRHVFAGAVGVDLNRNYPFGWSSACAGSTTPSSETYKGPSPASEAETQTMIAWGNDRHFTKVVDYHSYGREVLWGYSCLNHPLGTFLRNEAIALSNASGYGGGERNPSAEGEEQEWQLATHGTHGFLIETHIDFQPSYASAQSEANLLWPGVLWLLQRPIPLTGHVRDALNHVPVVATLTYSGVNFQNGEVNKSNIRFGRYHAFLPAGTRTVQFAAPGYVTKNVQVVFTSNTEQVLDVDLVRNWPLGDVNCDGTLNAFDIDPFVLALSNPAGYATAYPSCNIFNADCNNDGVINAFDIDPFVDLLTP